MLLIHVHDGLNFDPKGQAVEKFLVLKKNLRVVVAVDLVHNLHVQVPGYLILLIQLVQNVIFPADHFIGSILVGEDGCQGGRREREENDSSKLQEDAEDSFSNVSHIDIPIAYSGQSLHHEVSTRSVFLPHVFVLIIV